MGPAGTLLGLQVFASLRGVTALPRGVEGRCVFPMKADVSCSLVRMFCTRIESSSFPLVA